MNIFIWRPSTRVEMKPKRVSNMPSVVIKRKRCYRWEVTTSFGFTHRLSSARVWSKSPAGIAVISFLARRLIRVCGRSRAHNGGEHSRRWSMSYVTASDADTCQDHVFTFVITVFWISGLLNAISLECRLIFFTFSRFYARILSERERHYLNSHTYCSRGNHAYFLHSPERAFVTTQPTLHRDLYTAPKL